MAGKDVEFSLLLGWLARTAEIPAQLRLVGGWRKQSVADSPTDGGVAVRRAAVVI
jgi:hypothetical protein